MELSFELFVGSAMIMLLLWMILFIIIYIIQLTWAWVDDSKVIGNWLYDKIVDITNGEEYKIIVPSLFLPIIGFIIYTFPWVGVCAAIIIGVLFIARFSRRLSKKLNLHESNRDIHNMG